MKPKTVFVVGGANLDVSGTSDQALRLGDSNPGIAAETPGGVGRNIAEVLSCMGCQVQLVTALGDDLAGERIRESCRRLGIGLDYSLTLPDERTGTYLCLNHPNGDLLAAVSDMRIWDAIAPEPFLSPCLEALNCADLVVADANLPQILLNYLASHCRAPLAADPVSTMKAGRLEGCLSRLLAIKPNRAEAQVLTGIPLEGTVDFSALQNAARLLLHKGVGNVFITLGRNGVYYDNGTERGILERCPGRIVNTSGCGDAFFAASSLALVSGETVMQAARLGEAAAALCAEARETVSPKLTMESVKKRAALAASSI